MLPASPMHFFSLHFCNLVAFRKLSWGVCLELFKAVWSNSMQRSQLELIGIEYYSIPIQEKHRVCQVEMV